MSFDFSSMGTIHEKNDDILSPVDLFYNSQHPEIKDLFPIQRDILEEWYTNFQDDKKDNLIQLDTGAGKTLIGLFIAESLRKTKKGKILYICSNNFLVEQTKDKAEKYGLKVSTYHSQKFVGEDTFLSNDAICITNYSAVFSSNKFKSYDIKGVIFDDSHFGMEVIESKYSVQITKKDNEKLFNNIIHNFSQYPEIKKDMEVLEQRDSVINSIIPPLIWWENIQMIVSEIERDKNFDEYNWKYIKPIIDKTFCFFTESKIEISLLYPNLENEKILSDDVHKVFLSATINDIDDFIRFYNIRPEVIKKSNKYRPDRMFLFTKIIENKIENIDELMISQYNQITDKTLILVPSKNDFKLFEDRPNTMFLEDSESANEIITKFKDSSQGCLIIANRYEGIDIDGDAGNFMILFDILNHSSIKNKFFGERVSGQKNDFLRSNYAGKVIQAFGRTTRSSTDFSTIIIMGDKLNTLLLNDDNMKLFPQELVEDIRVGKLLSNGIKSHEDFLNLIKSNLTQDEGYKGFMKSQRTQVKGYQEISELELNNKIRIAQYERKMQSAFLKGDYQKLIQIVNNKEFEKLLINEKQLKTYGLYLIYSALGYSKINEYENAQKSYDRAVRITPYLGGNKKVFEEESYNTNSQVESIKQQEFQKHLTFSGDISASEYEENVKVLGDLLGFESYRPEKDVEGITLDNIWVDNDNNIVYGIECKNENTTARLNKADIGQSLDHYEWLKNTYKDYEINYFIAGEFEKITVNANPPEYFYLINHQNFKTLYLQLQHIYEQKELFINRIQESLKAQGLLGLKNVFKKDRKVSKLLLDKTN